SCIYPRDAVQPLTPDCLLTGALEPTNEAYALAKIAGVKLCQSYRAQYGRSYIAAMPCNLYGPYDRFDPVRSHVIPALMLKMHQAVQENAGSVTLWGTGAPLREFLHVDDLARGLLCALHDYDSAAALNIGSGAEVSIAALARLIAEVTGYRGEILFNPAQPDGVPRKILDSDVIRALGWQPDIDLRAGLQDTYDWFVHHHLENRGHSSDRAA
ncbi:MAG TPA: NAD-dependent epimerase/dehydratase family protein, partial [Micavibrio sp.]